MIPLHDALGQLQEALQAFVDQRLQSLDVVQQEVLAEIQLIGDKSRRHWLDK
ncbi:hypothetical protein [Sulfoacidibacillus thermotolerans]|uniref:hypothetical protein n=1 Tax=Sulfoacidibacillus thermotolerans TaxID=1765684 RepID=UPI0015E818DA|nr:hypothetical protein [Sulfoacidibacillus thermotolerans]